MNEMKSRVIGVSVLVLTLFNPVLHARESPNPGALAAAVASADMGRIDELLLLGADPNQRDLRGQTPLLYAVESGEFRMVERILLAKADPDTTGAEGLSPLMEAIRLGRSDLVEMLLSAGANPNLVSDTPEMRPVSALSIAVDRGEFAIAHRLIAGGGDGLFLAEPELANPLKLPLADVPLDARIWRGLSELRDNTDSPDWWRDERSLHQAARHKRWFDAREILDEGAAVDAIDSRGITPLMTAVWHGNASLVSLLLQRGAQIDVVDAGGRSVLCYAAAAGGVKILDSLLAADTAGLARNPETLENSPYYWAVIAGHPQMVSRLIAVEWPLPEPGIEGITLLMTAAWLSDTYSVRSLLPIVDDAEVLDDAGRSALEWSAAAFRRDRRTGRETRRPRLGDRNYAVARLLARRTKAATEYRSVVSPDIHPGVIEAWSLGRNTDAAQDWRDKKPSPVPMQPGDGDLTLYRIFRDEEQGLPSE